MRHQIENLTKILAIDQATLSGVCRVFIDGAGKPHYETFTIKPPKDQSTGGARLFYYEQWIASELRTGVQLVVIEGMAFGKQGNISVQIGITAIIQLLAHKWKIPVIEIAPHRVKKWACGGAGIKGNPDKIRDVFPAAKGEFGAQVKTADEADAAYLAQIGYYLGTGQNHFDTHRQEVLNDLRHPEIKQAEKQAAAKRKKTRIAAQKTQQLLPVQEAA